MPSFTLNGVLSVQQIVSSTRQLSTYLQLQSLDPDEDGQRSALVVYASRHRLVVKVEEGYALESCTMISYVQSSTNRATVPVNPGTLPISWANEAGQATPAAVGSTLLSSGSSASTESPRLTVEFLKRAIVLLSLHEHAR